MSNIKEVNDLLLGGDGAVNVLTKLTEEMKCDAILAACRMNEQAARKTITGTTSTTEF